MIIVGLMAGGCLYLVLYVAWSSSQSHLGSALPLLNVLNQAIFRPQIPLFAIFRGLMILFLLYAAADFAMSQVKQGRRRSKRSKENPLPPD